MKDNNIIEKPPITKQIVHLTATLFLKEIKTEKEVQDIVSEMKYEFTHPDIEKARVHGTIF